MKKILLLGLLLCCALALPAKIRFVNQNATGANNGNSWANAWRELRDALAAAQYGDEIWVAKGTYSPFVSELYDAFQLVSGVRLLGGFTGGETQAEQRDWVANETILSGARPDGKSIWNVVYCENTDSTTLLDGFTVRDGTAGVIYGNCSNVNPRQCTGGGLLVYNGDLSAPTRLTVRHCRFLQNQAAYGGGIAVNFSQGTGGLNVEHCYFGENYGRESGGGIHFACGPYTLRPLRVDSCVFERDTSYDASALYVICYNDTLDLRVTDCVFKNNRSQRDGSVCIYFSGTLRPLFDRCLFDGNRGGAFFVLPGRGGAMHGGEFDVYRCTFVNNLIRLGGAVSGRSLRIINCLFLKNKATSEGGALWITETNFLVNNSFIDNYSQRDGGAIYSLNKPNDTLVNCIFLRNHADQVGNSILFTGNSPKSLLKNTFVDVLDCSTLFAGQAFQNASLLCADPMYFNIDPQLRDPAAGDYRLRACSPLVDAGDGAWAARFGLETDLDGHPRIQDQAPDVGAYETPLFRPFIARQDMSCYGVPDGSLAISPVGGFPPYQYHWGNGDTSAQISQLSAGAYQVIAHDGDLCADTLSAILVEPAPLQIAPFVTAAGGSTQANGNIQLLSVGGGTPPYAFLWENGDTVAVRNNLLPGAYLLTLTDHNGCDTLLEIKVGIVSARDVLFATACQARITTDLADGFSGLEINCAQPEDLELSLLDASGRMCWNSAVRVSGGDSFLQALPAHLAKGIYFLRIVSSGRRSMVLKYRV